MNAETQRAELKALYPHNEAWQQKLDAMPAQEVRSTYQRLKAQNKL